MTQAEASDVLALLLAAFPTNKVTDAEATAVIWEDSIQDVEADVGRAAAIKLVMTSRFMPTVAEFREVVAELKWGVRKPGLAAWGEVLKAIGRYGARRPPGSEWTFEDPVITKVVTSMNWHELCLSEDHAADRARFIAMYDVEAMRAAQERVMGLPSGSTKQLPSGTRAVDAKSLPSGTRTVAESISVLVGDKLKKLTR